VDLATELLREHSAQQTQRLVRYVGQRAARLTELVSLTCGPPGRLSQLAAEILGWCGEAQPRALGPHLPRLMVLLAPSGHHPAVRRGVLRALQFVAIPEELQTETFNRCLELLGSGTEPVAIKAYALTVAAAIARPFPELAAEVIQVVEKQLPYASAGLRSRAGKELPALRRVLADAV
jgi:hypothetical protein